MGKTTSNTWEEPPRHCQPPAAMQDGLCRSCGYTLFVQCWQIVVLCSEIHLVRQSGLCKQTVERGDANRGGGWRQEAGKSHREAEKLSSGRQVFNCSHAANGTAAWNSAVADPTGGINNGNVRRYFTQSQGLWSYSVF